MNRIAVAPIVEGHGEVEAVRILLERVWCQLLGGEYVDVLQPIRRPRKNLAKETEFRKAMLLAVSKLRQLRLDDPQLVFVLIDADDDCPAEKGPEILTWAHDIDATADVACVIANVEYETWFVAAAESLERFLDLGNETPPLEPEVTRSGKKWIQNRFREAKYTETRHQPRMTNAMNLALCRTRSPSFDKLCRELEMRRVPTEDKPSD